MTHFLVRLADARSQLMTSSLVKAHVTWLHQLHNRGQLVLCGPCDDGTAIIVLRCETMEEASRISSSDPFAEAKAYSQRSIVKFNAATPENNFLLR
ncbi:YciI family protein [Allorhizobium sp. BGMRC 0089]|uniref:YciI family protein n=1 Tax=Allorhizobium sonneratiae TaxID=2934936 RepID=UPI0020334CAF|nr:YciI family protein [Allorhizobium sonneratiae]MCM2293687.1 YciI family protein [Allorhizobium sonneratiae]